MFVFLVGLQLLATAQDGCSLRLSGRVIDEHDGQPLGYANVYIKENYRGTVSDSLGNYQIANLCPGLYTVICTHIGCEPITQNIRLDSNTVLNFYPEHHSEFLLEIILKGKKKNPESLQVSDQISGRQLEMSQGTSLGDITKQVSGVSSLNTGSGIVKPVIHGLHSNRILILNNGIRHEAQQWGNEHAPEIDPYIAGSVTVIKGANTLRYGSDAIGGVILVEPRALRDSAGIGAVINLAGFTNGRQGVVSALLDGNLEKVPALSWRLQGTLRQGGNIHTPNYHLKNSGLKEYNFSAATVYSAKQFGIELFYSQFNTNIGIFSGAHIGNLTDLQIAFDSPTPLESSGFSYAIERPYQHIEHELFKLKSFVNTGKNGKLSLVYGRQYNLRYEYDKHRPINDSLAALNKPELQFEITTHTAELVWDHRWNKLFNGQVGMTGMHQANTYSGRFFIPNFRNRAAGIFWIERLIKTRYELEAGVRYDYRFMEVFIYENNVLTTPRYAWQNMATSFAAKYMFSENLKGTVNIGSAWRPPVVNELFSYGLHHGAASVEIGDRNLTKENAWHLTAAFDYEHKGFKLQISPYVNYIRNFIYLSPQLPPTLTIRGAFPTFYYRQVNAVFKGLDFTGSAQLNKSFSFVSKFSLLRALNQDKNEFLVMMPADRYQNSIEYHLPNHPNYRNGLISFTMLNVMKQWRVNAEQDFVPPPAAYTLFSAKAAVTLYFNKQPLELQLGVNNLFNTVYRDYLNRFRYYTDEQGRNISVRLKIPLSIYRPDPSK